MSTLKRLSLYGQLMRLHRPLPILLLLWPTLWALWLAGSGQPDYQVVLVFLAGVLVMRSAGCIINDYADRHVDGQVARTAKRPLATGEVSVKEAAWLFSGLLLLALGLVLSLNTLSFYYALAGLVLTMSYPFMKRFTNLPQVGLGFAFSWGVPMAFAAELGELKAPAWLLLFSAALWPLIYDTLYAMTDREDDRKVGIRSTAILFGQADRLILGLLQVLFLLALAGVGFVFQLRWPYFLAVALSSFFFIYQQKLIAEREPAQCFKAFLNNHWLGLVVFLGIVMSYL